MNGGYAHLLSSLLLTPHAFVSVKGIDPHDIISPQIWLEESEQKEFPPVFLAHSAGSSEND
jgi:hypothetical protein